MSEKIKGGQTGEEEEEKGVENKRKETGCVCTETPVRFYLAG